MSSRGITKKMIDRLEVIFNLLSIPLCFVLLLLKCLTDLLSWGFDMGFA